MRPSEGAEGADVPSLRPMWVTSLVRCTSTTDPAALPLPATRGQQHDVSHHFVRQHILLLLCSRIAWYVTVGSPAARGLGYGAVASPHLIIPWGGGRGTQTSCLRAALTGIPCVVQSYTYLCPSHLSPIGP